ncbi:cysteine peptidase family C39 domain-containing protein [Candidatus Eisenbacteria bacterium]|uniref:Cysteine peptidase family C39 domain-containing protein n=1 Tax=Eiseniibacteriota bacterium TaxID=2212470 RepID=A0ABV6YMN4_UNCEI
MPMLLGSIVLAAALGILESSRIVRHNPEVDVQTIHKDARYLVPAALSGMALAAIVIVAGLHRGFFWFLPMWAGLAFRVCLWSLILFLASFLFSLGATTMFRTRHTRRWSLALAGLALVVALFSLQWRLYRPVADTLGESIAADGLVHQTSGISCAAATGANISRMAGLEKTEREMAALMETCMLGTELPRIERAMQRLGFESRRVQVAEEDISVVKPPAMLFVDHPQAGAESHVVAYFGPKGDTYEVWDPLDGPIHMDPERLSACWHGRALELHVIEGTGRLRLAEHD